VRPPPPPRRPSAPNCRQPEAGTSALTPRCSIRQAAVAGGRTGDRQSPLPRRIASSSWSCCAAGSKGQLELGWGVTRARSMHTGPLAPSRAPALTLHGQPLLHQSPDAGPQSLSRTAAHADPPLRGWGGVVRRPRRHLRRSKRLCVDPSRRRAQSPPRLSRTRSTTARALRSGLLFGRRGRGTGPSNRRHLPRLQAGGAPDRHRPALPVPRHTAWQNQLEALRRQAFAPLPRTQ